MDLFPRGVVGSRELQFMSLCWFVVGNYEGYDVIGCDVIIYDVLYTVRMKMRVWHWSIYEYE